MKLTLLLLFCIMAFLSIGQDSLRTQKIKEVNVSHSRKKEIAFKDSRYYIMDFHIDSNGAFVLLNRFSKYYIYLLDSDMNVKVKKLITFHPKSLFLDCTGLLHVFSKDTMFRLERSADTLLFTEKQSLDMYKYYYRDCSASNDVGLIFKSERNYSQTTEYYQIENVSKFNLDVYEVTDSTLVRSARETEAEIKKEEYRLRRKYSRTLGSRAPTWEDQTQEGQLRNDRSSEIQRHLDKRQFYGQFVLRPHYNPLFIMDDTTFVFDHVNGEMVRLTMDREVLDKRPIGYHNEKHWKGEVQLDTKRNIFYTVEEKHGAQIFGRVSLESGEVDRKTKITKHAYPEKVIVYNGFAYYVYRQFVDDNLNKLFRQRI
ncbi:MAG: hypothetical protein HRT57_03870 [Crocinitomicaceae bacterium]|nr:hypothetical protein [Crocinitomicaceae bacterium]